MKNLFTCSALTKKETRELQTTTNKATAAALRDFVKSIEAEFSKVVKSEDRAARNLANAVKGRYQTALNAVAACYPYQTAEPEFRRELTDKGGWRVSVTGGALLYKKAVKDDNGAVVGRVWAEQPLTRGAAAKVVRESLRNYTNTIGNPVVVVGEVGAAVVE